ncbi:MAG: winged helix-turn-helix domain-containing protein [Thermoanaerobaculia bacterium]|nr:winged helix-turn-helix domain-containing protein [Thermoanaerobaculia bacterium]
MSTGSAAPEASIPQGLEPPAWSALWIGECLVEPELLQLTRAEQIHRLEPMAMRLLLFLAERPEQVVPRAVILEEVWEGRAVVDETLSRAMSLVRQALGDSAQQPSYIQTIPTRGYRLIAPVRRPRDEARGARAPDIRRTSWSARLGWRIWAPLLVTLVLVGLWLASDRSQQQAAPGVPRDGGAEWRPSIAVLPFVSLSPDPEDAFLADGLTEELIHQLASVSGLRVVSRTSSMHFRDSSAAVPDIARTLGVDYLLEGTVQVIDQRLRVSAQLIEPDRQEHLMSQTYDRKLEEVLALQREVAREVVRQTRARLSAAEDRQLADRGSIDAEAYRTYLRGQQTLRKRQDVLGGRKMLERSLALDPSFAPAWAALADAHLLSSAYAGRPEYHAYDDAEHAIERALDLDPRLAAAHASLGLLSFQRDRDWTAAEASYQRAIEHERSYVTARQWYSEFLSILGRHQEAIEQIQIAIELDPLSPLVHAAAGQRFNAAGRYHEALERLRDSAALGADFRWQRREMAWALERLGREQEALELRLEYERRRRPADDPRLRQLEQATVERGLAGLYAWDLEILLTETPDRPGYATWVATAYAGADRPEEALEWVAKAAREPNLWLSHFQKAMAFDRLRDDTRFIAALGDLPGWRPQEPDQLPTPAASRPNG